MKKLSKKRKKRLGDVGWPSCPHHIWEKHTHTHKKTQLHRDKMNADTRTENQDRTTWVGSLRVTLFLAPRRHLLPSLRFYKRIVILIFARYLNWRKGFFPVFILCIWRQSEEWEDDGRVEGPCTHCFTPQNGPKMVHTKARSLEFRPGLPHACRCPRTQITFISFPGTLAGSWREKMGLNWCSDIRCLLSQVTAYSDAP